MELESTHNSRFLTHEEADGVDANSPSASCVDTVNGVKMCTGGGMDAGTGEN
jgi:hypothetical protein